MRYQEGQWKIPADYCMMQQDGGCRWSETDSRQPNSRNAGTSQVHPAGDDKSMKMQKLFHRCGYPVLNIAEQVGPAERSYFVDANNPVVESAGGKNAANVITRCPQCKGFIKLEKLYSAPPPPEKGEAKAPSGYIPARMGSKDDAK
jgi:hypothetical protein